MAIPIVEISDDDFLYRRLSLDHFNPDNSVNSNAYKLNGKPDPQVSVDLSRLTSVWETLSRAPGPQFKIGVLQAKDARALGLLVRHEPLDDNPAHSVIERNSSRSNCRDLAAKTWMAAF